MYKHIYIVIQLIISWKFHKSICISCSYEIHNSVTVTVLHRKRVDFYHCMVFAVFSGESGMYPYLTWYQIRSMDGLLSAFKDSLICCCPWNLKNFKSCYWLLSESWRLIIMMKLKANSSAFITWKYKPQIFNHLGSTIVISHALWNTVCSFPELFQPDIVNLN